MRSTDYTALMLLLLVTPVAAQQRPAGGPPLPDGMPLYMPGALDVPLNAHVAELGRALFFDRRLSRDRSVSCASCHLPERAFTDGRTVSTGVAGRQGRRNAPTLVNRAWGDAQFWDGRVASLRDQVLHPIEDPDEMGFTRDAAAARIAADPALAARFAEVLDDSVHAASLARSLAAYVASIIAGDAPFDRWAAGDTTALSAEARHGRRLFDGRARCSVCHRGPNFTDEQFHNTGVAWRAGAPADSGRFAVTGRERDIGAFKTPTLREIARTAPYMHDGSIASLEAVIDFYDRGGFSNPYLDRELQPLGLSGDDKQALIAFLGMLSGRVREGGGQGGGSPRFPEEAEDTGDSDFRASPFRACAHPWIVSCGRIVTSVGRALDVRAPRGLEISPDFR
jgi:cytochrome c peroxidase